MFGYLFVEVLYKQTYFAANVLLTFSRCSNIIFSVFFKFAWWGVESILGPPGTSATEWPIVPAPGDCDDGEFGGMKIGRGNRSTRRKPTPAPLNPP
jgi:hypothetical protein